MLSLLIFIKTYIGGHGPFFFFFKHFHRQQPILLQKQLLSRHMIFFHEVPFQCSNCPLEITFNLGLAQVLNMSAVFIHNNQCLVRSVGVGLEHFFLSWSHVIFSCFCNLWGVQYSVQLRKALTLRTVLHPNSNTGGHLACLRYSLSIAALRWLVSKKLYR